MALLGLRLGRGALVTAALVAAWFALSSASNVVGKLVLGSLPRPATLALVQLLAAAALSLAALPLCPPAQRAAPPPAPGEPTPPLMLLALAKVLTVLCSQVSIWRVPVSYAHTVKATTPLWTAALSWWATGARVSGGVARALACIALGVALASAAELQFDAGGLLAALAAAALLAAQHVYGKRALAQHRVPPLRLLLALSWRGAALLLPAWLWLDGAALWAGADDAGGTAAALLAADGALAWLQAAAALAVLARVQPLTYAVASSAKRAVIVLASLAVLRNPAPPLNLAGMALALAGVALYSRARHCDRARALLPV